MLRPRASSAIRIVAGARGVASEITRTSEQPAERGYADRLNGARRREGVWLLRRIVIAVWLTGHTIQRGHTPTPTSPLSPLSRK